MNKPRIAFVRRNLQGLSADKLEQDHAKKFKLTSFVYELDDARLAHGFENHHQLGGDVYFSLNELRKQRPAARYIKADQVKEIFEELQREIDDLKYLNKKLSQDYRLMKALAGTETSSEAQNEIPFPGSDKKIRPLPQLGLLDTVEAEDLHVELGRVFVLVAERLHEYDELTSCIAHALEEHIATHGIVVNGEGRRKINTVVPNIRLDFINMNLVVADLGKWQLTPNGELQHKFLKIHYSDPAHYFRENPSGKLNCESGFSSDRLRLTHRIASLVYLPSFGSYPIRRPSTTTNFLPAIPVSG